MELRLECTNKRYEKKDASRSMDSGGILLYAVSTNRVTAVISFVVYPRASGCSQIHGENR